MYVEVGKLTVRAVGTRRRAEYLLRTFEWRQPGLPEHAILVVRHLQIDHSGDRGTDQRARTALAELGRTAARPTGGPVPARANAVVFGDEAELLSCLTADLVRGVAGDRWYWRRIQPARTGGRGTALAAAWLRDVRWLPATIARLTDSQATDAVALLSPAEIALVADALLSAYGVPTQRPGQLPSGTRHPTAAPVDAAEQPTPEPPWRQSWPAASFAHDGAVLLSLARNLHRSPDLVRRLGYPDCLAPPPTALRQPWRSQHTAASRPPKPTSDSRSPVAAALAGPIPAAAAPDEPVQASDVTVLGQAARYADQDRGTEPPVTHSEPRLRSPRREPAAAAPRSGAAMVAPAWLGAGATPTTGEPGAAPDRDPYPPAASEWHAEGVESGLASLLFLVNLVVWLDPDDDAALPGGWTLVELLGRYLLRANLSDLADDPIWGLLAGLDGRHAGSLAAVDLGPESAMRLPRSWLRRWLPADGGLIARPIGPHLVIRHREGEFVVADVPCPEGQVRQVCQAEAELFDVQDIIIEPGITVTNRSPAQRFDDCLGAFAIWLLRSHEVEVSALAAPGRVTCTATHVDVDLNLESVDLAVRVAGLDQDPGWVPSFGRIVLFHYR